MDPEREKLWPRERDRRHALWKLQGLRPGNPAAWPYLEVLDAIEQQDLQDPIGSSWQLTVEQLENLVPISEQEGHSLRFVRDEDIPQPWKTRFEEASALSTRYPEGSYEHDWLNFLSLWDKEMQSVDQHRRTRHLWTHEQQRWALLQQLQELPPGDVAARPLLDALGELEAQDDPRIKPVYVLREIVEEDEIENDVFVISDRRLPLPWNLRLALFMGRLPHAPDSSSYFHSALDWHALLSTWETAETHVQAHRKELGCD